MTSSTEAAVPAVPPGTAEPVWHTLSADQVLSIQAVAEPDGLSPAEAASRAERFGPNKFTAAVGVPFLPLQTLWVNFTTQVFQAIGLGYGKPAEGLMGRKPRQPDQPILPRGMIIWLVTVGVVMGVGTLGVISWAEQARSLEIAHTMGLVTFSLFNLFFSMAARDELKTVFSLDTFSDRTFGIATAAAVPAG